MNWRPVRRRDMPKGPRCAAVARTHQSAATRAGNRCEWTAERHIDGRALCFTHAAAYQNGMSVRFYEEEEPRQAARPAGL